VGFCIDSLGLLWKRRWRGSEYPTHQAMYAGRRNKNALSLDVSSLLSICVSPGIALSSLCISLAFVGVTCNGI
jgi:hypothetical protein